jgi:hypothetical protein
MTISHQTFSSLIHTQSHPLEEVYIMESYYMTFEDSLSVGDNYDDNEIGRFNNLVKQNLLPVGIMTVEFLPNKSFRRPLKVLFDTGSTRTLVNKDVVTPSVEPHALTNLQYCTREVAPLG